VGKRVILMRVLAAGVVLAMIVAGILLPEEATDVTPDGSFAPLAPAVAVCPITLDRTTDGVVAVASRVSGISQGTAVASGGVLAEPLVEIDGAGGAVLPFADVAISGVAGLLVELPGIESAVASTVSGRGEAVANCTAPATSTTLAVGGSTRGGEGLEVILVNPYAVDAVATVASSSEAGADSASELQTVFVPRFSVVVKDLDELLPLRNRLSVAITTSRGQVHGFLLQEVDDDRALIEAVVPGSTWYMPLGSVVDGATEVVVVATASPVDIEVRIDGLIDGRWVEGVWESELPARSQVELDLSELATRPGALRVGSDGLIAPALVLESGGLRGATPMVPFLATELLAPGSSSGVVAQVAAASDLAASVTFLPVQSGQLPVSVELAAGESREVVLPASSAGFTVSASSEVVVAWRSTTDESLALAVAVPIPESAP
jgi:hypothetical protein